MRWYRDMPLKRKLRLGVLFLLLASFAAYCYYSFDGDAITVEHQVKAAFLFQFSQHVKWPASTFPDSGSPLVIGVLGDNPFGDSLHSATRGEMSNGRKIVVQHSRHVDDLRNCQFLFVTKSETGRLSEVLSPLEGSSVLTVGESDRFCDLGGIINFTTQDHKVGYEINVDAAKRAGLEVSPKLVKLGKIHRGG